MVFTQVTATFLFYTFQYSIPFSVRFFESEFESGCSRINYDSLLLIILQVQCSDKQIPHPNKNHIELITNCIPSLMNQPPFLWNTKGTAADS